jgi:DNA processing protein
MTEHGSAQAALEALPAVARAAGVDDYSICPLPVVHEELRQGRLFGARALAYGSEAYPASLMEVADAPPILWAIGDLSVLKRPIVAIVGARNASSLGTRMSRSLAEGLGQAGHTIVSGLARGIDTAAHLASLETGTVAVLAGGVNVVYPAENAVLAQEIAEKGVRLSEQPLGVQPTARHFPARNRIISGLARALVVVEAAAKSGSLITARNALDQGRDVLAVPGHPFDGRAAGCNMLLRDGATLVRGPKDVIEALQSVCGHDAAAQHRQNASADDAPKAHAAQPAEPTQHPASAEENPHSASNKSLRDANKLHNEILSRLGPSPVAEDQLIRDLNVPAKTVAPELVTLELEGKIQRQPGGLLALAQR